MNLGANEDEFGRSKWAGAITARPPSEGFPAWARHEQARHQPNYIARTTRFEVSKDAGQHRSSTHHNNESVLTAQDRAWHLGNNTVVSQNSLVPALVGGSLLHLGDGNNGSLEDSEHFE